MPSFTVQSLDGATVRSEDFLINSKWILLYLTRDCNHCDELLKSLEVFQDPLMSKRLIIVVGGGDAKAIQRLIDPPEKITLLGWYSDPDWQHYETFPISATPIVLGVENGIIHWSFIGKPWERRTMQSILGSWINY
jgi:hypothetical protein